MMGVGGRSALMMTNMLVLIVTSRLLTPSDFGRFAIVQLIVDFAAAASYAFIGIPILQAHRLRTADYSNAFTMQLIFGVATGAILFASAGLVEQWLRMPGLAPLLQVAAFLLPVRCATSFFIATLQRRSKVGQVTLAQTKAQIISALGVTLVLASLGFGAWSLLLGLAVAALLEMIWCAAAAKMRPQVGLTRAAFRRAKDGLAPLAARMLHFGSDSIDRLVVGSRFGDSALGIYTRALSLVLIPTNLIGMPVQNALLSWFSRIKGSTTRVAETLDAALAVQGLLLIPATVGLWITSPLLVRVVLGEQWLAAIPIAQVLFVGVMARLATAAFESASMTLGYAWGTTRRQILAAVVLLIGLAAAVGHSVIWVAVAVSTSRVINYALTMRFVVITFGGSWRLVAVAHAKSLILLSGGLAAAWLSGRLISLPSSTAGELLMISSYALGCAAVLVFGPKWLVAPAGPMIRGFLVSFGRRWSRPGL